MSDINKALSWMQQRQGKVSYSMTNRLGPSSYDCSSAVYLSLIDGGFLPNGMMGNTDSLFNHLEKAGWEQVKADSNGNYPAKRGDVFIWGNRGGSGGAAGHTGIFIDNNDNIIHCNYGYNGITVNDHDTIWTLNGQPPVAIYRYMGTGNSTETQNKPTIEKDEDIMFKYIKVLKNGTKEVWLVFGNKRMHLGPKQLADANLLLTRTGHSTKEEQYSHDNYALKMIEKFTDVVKF